MLRQDDVQKTQLVLVGWRYGHSYGGHLPALMIMGCIANRVRRGWGSWLDVIERIPHFSAENVQPELKFPSIWEPAFVRLLHEVEGVYDGSGVDYSKGGLYWAHLSRIDRDWFREAILRQPDVHPRIVDSGPLSIFA